MQSTSDTSNQSAAHTKVDEPRKLTTRAIKYLQDSHETKHHFNLDYVLQITRIREINEGKNGAA
jgi:hypothetical protein